MLASICESLGLEPTTVCIACSKHDVNHSSTPARQGGFSCVLYLFLFICLFVSSHKGGVTPSPSHFTSNHCPMSFLGVSQVPGSFRDLCSQVLSRGGTPVPNRGRGTLVPGGGYSCPGVLCQPGLGYPYPPLQNRTGVPLARTGLGYSPPPSGQDRTGVPGYTSPPNQINRVSTCYTVGGMPLAFTQEDFLVTT